MSNFDLESEQAFAMCHENHRRAAQRPVVLLLAAAAPAPLGSAEPEDEPLEVYADCEDVTVDDCNFTAAREENRAMTSSVFGMIWLCLSTLAVTVVAYLALM